jgi:hypothetical protein
MAFNIRRGGRIYILNSNLKSGMNIYIMELLHTYQDGSKLYKMSALALTKIPIWKGNRIIDLNHVNNIKSSIQHNAYLLDSGYKIIQYEELDETDRLVKKSYVIDGQHRISVVNDYFENTTNAKDFDVTITEIRVESEIDAIDYFNKINNVKPIQFEEDPNLVVNKYIKKLSEAFLNKNKLIRSGITKRPYLSSDKFREILKKFYHKLKNISIDEFVSQCKIINSKTIQDLEIRSLNQDEKDIKLIHRILELNFALAWDDKYKWLQAIFND